MPDPKLFAVEISGTKDQNTITKNFVAWASNEPEAIGLAILDFTKSSPGYAFFHHNIADITHIAKEQLVFPHTHTETPARQALDLLYSEVITSGFRTHISKTALDTARAVVRPQATQPTLAERLENASERPRSAPTTHAATPAAPITNERLENALRLTLELREEILALPGTYHRDVKVIQALNDLLVKLRG